MKKYIFILVFVIFFIFSFNLKAYSASNNKNESDVVYIDGYEPSDGFFATINMPSNTVLVKKINHLDLNSVVILEKKEGYRNNFNIYYCQNGYVMYNSRSLNQLFWNGEHGLEWVSCQKYIDNNGMPPVSK